MKLAITIGTVDLKKGDLAKFAVAEKYARQIEESLDAMGPNTVLWLPSMRIESVDGKVPYYTFFSLAGITPDKDKAIKYAEDALNSIHKEGTPWQLRDVLNKLENELTLWIARKHNDVPTDSGRETMIVDPFCGGK